MRNGLSLGLVGFDGAGSALVRRGGFGIGSAWGNTR